MERPINARKTTRDLAEAGYDEEKLEGMKDLIDAKESDVYDVLAFVAYAREAITRQDRVKTARPNIAAVYTNYKQKAFIDFILEKYLENGESELASGQLKDLIRLKYNTINDAAVELGPPGEIRAVFTSFQRYLYEPT